VKSLVEKRYKDEPEVVTRYREANRSMGEEFRRLGVGSLAWQVQEFRISGDDELLRFISRPENAPLLEGYFSTLAPELASQLRAAMARQSGKRCLQTYDVVVRHFRPFSDGIHTHFPLGRAATLRATKDQQRWIEPSFPSNIPAPSVATERT
jgi:hypothetical protein